MAVMSPLAPADGDSDSPVATGGRPDRLARAVLLALALAFIVAVADGAGLGTDGTEGARLGGDYPAFHAAGSIVLDGDLAELYSPDRQQAAQSELGIDGYLAFAYPPHVAWAYAPLAALGFRAGYVVHTVLMLGALVAAIRLVTPLVPALAGRAWPATAVALTFYPVLRAVGGGQNTALTVLVFAVVWRALADDREALAGVAAGLLLYRPQYALPLVGLMLLDRRWRAVAAAAAVGAVTWILTALAIGSNWVAEWLDAVVPFVDRDAEVNSANSISFIGWLDALTGGSRVAVGLGAVLAGLVVLVLMRLWIASARPGLAHRIGAVAAGVLLISPHTMYYDAGLLLVTAAAALALPLDRGRVLAAVALVWLAALSQTAADALGATPLAVVVIAVFGVWLLLESSTPEREGVAAHA